VCQFGISGAEKKNKMSFDFFDSRNIYRGKNNSKSAHICTSVSRQSSNQERGNGLAVSQSSWGNQCSGPAEVAIAVRIQLLTGSCLCRHRVLKSQNPIRSGSEARWPRPIAPGSWARTP
jgi:hypothetical protein